jgi:hypothetical protein
MSNTLVRPDDTNLSPSRTSDGISKDAAAIPAVNPTADGRSDSVRKFAEPLPAAPLAQTSRRGFLMNTMVSAASLATATAVAAPSFAPAPDDAELLGWVDQLWALVPRYRQIYAQFEGEEAKWFKRRPRAGADYDAALVAAQIPYDEISKEMAELEDKVFSTGARTLAGVKAKAHWHLQFQCDGDIDQLDGSHCHVESLFLELGGDEPHGTSELDPRLGGVDHGGGSRPDVDPIFAALEAHRVAADALELARKPWDAVDETRPEARIKVGEYRKQDIAIVSNERGGKTIDTFPTEERVSIFASDRNDLRRSAPEGLSKSEVNAWIEERFREIEAEQERIDVEWSRSDLGKIEMAYDDAYKVERSRTWDLIWTTPTTIQGLAALLGYCREASGICELVQDEWQMILEWTIESATCAVAGFPEPPMSDVVAAMGEPAE